MNAMDLRIGNYLNNKDGILMEVFCVAAKSCCVNIKDGTSLYKESKVIGTLELLPIPLDETWLEVFGFEMCNYECFTAEEDQNGPDDIYLTYTIPHNDFEYRVDLTPDRNNDFYLYRKDENQNELEIVVTKLQYVHELQNIFWVLAKRELKIKESNLN